jgi:hypothetical protein
VPTLKRAPRLMAEKAVQGYLSVFELLSSATLVLSAPQAASLLVAPLPTSAGNLASAQQKDPAVLMRTVQAAVVSAVVPLWKNEKLADCPQAIVSQVRENVIARLLSAWPLVFLLSAWVLGCRVPCW